MEKDSIVILVLAILIAISYFGTALSEGKKKTLFIIMWLFVSGFLFLGFVLKVEQLNEAKLLSKKCPEYVKVENVYKLK